MQNKTTVNIVHKAENLNYLSSITDFSISAIPETENTKIFHFLKSLQEFSQVPESDLRTLAHHARFQDLDAGQYIATEGTDESLYGYIVASGIVAISKNSINGKELIVELLQPKDIFGLLLMLARDELPVQLSARAIQKTTVLWVSIKSFMLITKNNPFLSREFAIHLLSCLQSSYAISRGLAHDQVEVRIAAILVSLSLKFTRGKTENKVFTIKFTRQQLADLTGTTPETAIRITRAMQQKKFIDITRPGIIHILNIEALQELANL